MAMTQISKFVSMLPEDKRINVITDSIAAIGGQQFVDRYAPEVEEHPTGIDASIASLENNAFMQGGEIVLDTNQNHYIHCSVHLQFFGTIIQAVQGQKLDPRKALRCLHAGGPHLLLHLKYLEQDPTRKDQFNALNQQTSELMKMADQVAKLAERIDEQEKAQAEQQQQPNQQSPEMLRVQKLNELDQARAENDMKIRTAKAEQQMRIKDVTTAQRVQLTTAAHVSKYRSMEE